VSSRSGRPAPNITRTISASQTTPRDRIHGNDVMADPGFGTGSVRHGATGPCGRTDPEPAGGDAGFAPGPKPCIEAGRGFGQGCGRGGRAEEVEGSPAGSTGASSGLRTARERWVDRPSYAFTLSPLGS
jgi:hypothetical protein